MAWDSNLSRGSAVDFANIRDPDGHAVELSTQAVLDSLLGKSRRSLPPSGTSGEAPSQNWK